MKSLGGCLLLLAWIFVIVHAYFPGALRHVSAICLWLSVCFLYSSLSDTSRKQISILFLITIGLGVVVYGMGGSVDFLRFFEINETMCTMFAAGSFLSLVSHRKATGESLHGWRGIFSTFGSANILGGVINLAAIYVIGDRLSRNNGQLTKEQTALISRGFSAATYWSPFFVGCAVAISLSNGMRLCVTIPCGILLSLATMVISYIEIVSKSKKVDRASKLATSSSLEKFEGYSLSWHELKLPALLMLSVLLFHFLDPARSILIIISIVIPLVVLLFMERDHLKVQLHTQVHDNFPSMAGQIALYLMAGALSTVISAFLKLGHVDFLTSFINGFGPFEAMIALCLIVLISYCGLHPIITIYTIVPLINKFDPDPTLVGLLILIGWGLGITVSPLSAANLSFIGRYHTSGGMILRMNRMFVFKILIVCYGLFWLETYLVQW